MNLSTIMTRIKSKLGLAAIATPFLNIDEVILEYIQDITRPVYSIYEPYRESLNLRVNDLERVEKGSFYETYLLPDFRTRNLLYVFDVNYDTESLTGLGYYGGGMPFMQGGLINQVQLANAGAHVMNYMVPKLTFKFTHPRKITLYNLYSSSRVVFELGFEHDKSLASIPDTASESFFNLALLDVKENLWPTVKMNDELRTAIGEVNLKLNRWEEAEADRKEMLREWDDTYHLDIGPPCVYI